MGMELKEIVPSYHFEDQTHAVIAAFNHADSIHWLKTIDGFANACGGVLFIGVEDGTNQLIGFESEEADKERLYFYHEIKDHFDISPLITTEIIPYAIKNKERYLLKITIGESDRKPLMLKYQGMPQVYIRRDGYTNAASSEEMLQMLLSGKKPQFDQGPTNILFDPKDFTKLYAFYHENTGKELKEKELASIGFFDENRHLRQGATLFSDHYDGEKTAVVCSLYRGLTRGDDEILSSQSFQGNLIDCYRYLWSFVVQRMNRGFRKLENKRVDFDAYPMRSLFEAIINSLAHRDYLLDGTAIYADLFRNRLVLSSPGRMTGSIQELAPTYHSDSWISRRRNELISNVFILCKAMEAKGTGFEKIIEDYKAGNQAQKPFIFSKNNQFSIVLPDLTYEDGVELSEESLSLIQPILGQGKFDLPILSFCYTSSRSVKEIVDRLGISNSTFFRKNVLSRLVEQGFLTEGKEGNTTIYSTNTAKVFLR